MNEYRGLWRGKVKDEFHDCSNGEWVKGNLIITQFPNGSIDYQIKSREYEGITSLSVDASTLGECTGLRDKNGKLIFEGDIISFMESTEKNYVTKWDKENACFYFDRDVYVKACCVSQHGIIIGNIHDNPELLQEGAAADE